jgi:hypothetical protein
MIEKNGFWRIPPASKSELRNFGLIMALAATAIGMILWYKGSVDTAQGVGLVAAAFIGLGVGVPSILRPLYTLWMLFARVLGFINTHILLGLVFYTIFTVIGLVMRILRHDPLDRTLDPEEKSYWSRREPTQFSRNHFERQF